MVEEGADLIELEGRHRHLDVPGKGHVLIVGEGEVGEVAENVPGAPIPELLRRAHVMFQIGIPPVGVDILTSVSGLEFYGC